MADSALLIDVGNTRLKWGLAGADGLGRTGQVAIETLQSTHFSALTTRIPRRVTQVLVSNVAGPTIGSRLSSVIGLHTGKDVHFARCVKSGFGIRTAYQQPRRLGVDRFVAMVGAYDEFRSALCVVDAGTAITIDVLDKNGEHLGGQIIPGLRMMSDSLRNETSDISHSQSAARAPGEGLGIFGKTTAQAVSFGTVAAAAGAVELAVKRMRSSAYRPRIVLTGGDASRILNALGSKAVHRPHLVLHGLSTMVSAKI